jgi:hypothetical protein
VLGWLRGFPPTSRNSPRTSIYQDEYSSEANGEAAEEVQRTDREEIQGSLTQCSWHFDYGDDDAWRW